MQNHLGWNEIALRLLLTAAGGSLIGLDRGEHGHPAGLRTTLLVSLAAAISMIQVNLLLPIAGKAQNSYVVMDLMRLPLGILSGMGFIGAGAILRKENRVEGVTTAATLWFVTVMGLCFGGGQLALGLIALGLGWIVLSVLKPAKKWWKQDRQATLMVTSGSGGPTQAEIRAILAAAGYRIVSLAVVYAQGEAIQESTCHVRWRGVADESQPPAFVGELAARKSALKVAWQPS